MQGEVAGIAREQHADIAGRLHRAGHVEEVQQLLAGADHHAEKEGDLGERRAQALDLGAELAAVEGSATMERPPGFAPGASGW